MTTGAVGLATATAATGTTACGLLGGELERAFHTDDTIGYGSPTVVDGTVSVGANDTTL